MKRIRLVGGREARPGMAAGLILLVAFALWTSAAAAATPSEILEKAIHTEETVGNVDEAIKLYQQVIAEGQAARTAAAQAQYRLALCYVKKSRQAEAVAAFERLIKEYPQETDLIAKARKHLPSEVKLEPAPWGEGDALQLNMKLATGLDIGTFVYQVGGAKHEGKDAWRVRTRSMITVDGIDSYSTVLAHKESFLPISSRWKHSLLGDVEATYQSDKVMLKDLLKNSTREVKLDGPVFDNEQATELFRRLPLAVGYKTSLPIFTTLGSGLIRIDLEVPAKESVKTPAGTFECFQVKLKVLDQTFFIADTPQRQLVKFDAGGVTAELAKIYPAGPNGSTKGVELNGSGYRLTLPEGWYAYSPKPLEKSKPRSAFLLEIDGSATAVITSAAPETLKERSSAKAWTETALEQIKSGLQGFKLREPGIVEGTLAGHPSSRIVADYTDRGKAMVMIGANVLAENVGITIKASVPAAQFEAFEKRFEQVTGGLKIE